MTTGVWIGNVIVPDALTDQDRTAGVRTRLTRELSR